MKLAEPEGLIHHHYQVSTGLTLHAVERPLLLGAGGPASCRFVRCCAATR